MRKFFFLKHTEIWEGVFSRDICMFGFSFNKQKKLKIFGNTKKRWRMNVFYSFVYKMVWSIFLSDYNIQFSGIWKKFRSLYNGLPLSVINFKYYIGIINQLKTLRKLLFDFRIGCKTFLNLWEIRLMLVVLMYSSTAGKYKDNLRPSHILYNYD